MKTIKSLARSFTRLFVTTAFLLTTLAGIASPVAARKAEPGMLYTQSNAASGNSILAFSRADNGALTFQGEYASGGLGSGASLGSQGAVALTSDNKWLLTVNAGSNELSVFAVKSSGLELAGVTASGGSLPVSLTVFEHNVYVLNGGGSGNISGFRLDKHGLLSAIPGSTQALSNGGVGAAPGGAEISFSPDGETLVVTEKATNLVDTFRVEDGLAGPVVTHPSSGPTPFGFAFNSRGTLVVSEAFGGQPGLSALSSYSLEDEHFSAVSPSVGTTQTAACWVAISKNGKFAYTTNAGSGTISSYTIDRHGAISLLNPAAGSTGPGSSPVDMAFSSDGAFLYALSAAAHTISAFQMGADGSLTALGATSVPVGVAGLAAR